MPTTIPFGCISTSDASKGTGTQSTEPHMRTVSTCFRWLHTSQTHGYELMTQLHLDDTVTLNHNAGQLRHELVFFYLTHQTFALQVCAGCIVKKTKLLMLTRPMSAGQEAQVQQ